MSDKLKLLSDLDGVVAHSQPCILDEFNAKFDKNLTYADWINFDFLTQEAVRLSGEEPAIVAGWLYSAEVVSRAGVVPGANSAINELAKLGVSTEVATSRPANQAKMTQDWVQTNVPRIEWTYVRKENDPSAKLKGDEFKVEMVKQLRANVYVDDDPKIIDILSDLLKTNRLAYLQKLILVNRPWNDNYIAPKDVLRVGNWKNGDFGWSGIVDLASKMM